MTLRSLSAAEARRIALAAQGFADRRPRVAPGRAHLARVFDRVGLIQIDSVNAVARSHYLPPFARLGAYDPAVLEAAAWGPRKSLFEYWGHEASLIPMRMHPLFRWRMEAAARGDGTYKSPQKLARERPEFIRAVEDEIRRRGPLGAGDLEVSGKSKGGWWGWSDGKTAVEWLFWAGRLSTATRRGFERLYDVTERVIPAAVLNLPTPAPEEAKRQLLMIAARSLGVATEPDLRDYFRLSPQDSRAALLSLAADGSLERVAVEGWSQPAYLDPQAQAPRRVRASALLSPFDSLVWRRERAERLFDFRYRLEIYTPAHKREFGYYVLPYLLGETIPARLDLKSDRAAGALRVKAAHLQPGAKAARVAPPLAADLRETAKWLGLSDVRVEGHDPLAEALRAEL